MKKKFLLIIILLVVLVTLSVMFYFNYGLKTKNPKKVCFEDNCFYIEIAKSAEEISHGLMLRENLDPDKGMFFIFSTEGNYSFWMKDTLIPLDIIWINTNKEIVFISKNSQPCKARYTCFSIDPGKNAKYVLEINAGIADKMSLNIGDKVVF